MRRFRPCRWRYKIRDEGPGFDSNAPSFSSDDYSEAKTKRGLVLIRSLMDHVEFNATGNEITMVKRREPDPDGQDMG
jgi:anti-sigma regulatory factor (Ser/Thr protein kinase)